MELGQAVQTPDGRPGRIAAPSSGARFEYYELSNRENNIAVYAVMQDDTGEVRFFHEGALTPFE
ncbi:hypothetical protein [Microbacterium aerolatum]|uniref:hypothetical protein n=1 Tax=Microbacterium aerolatum TaxID=153731 RepID=UPI00384EF66E